MSNYHVPVMLTECLDGLEINPEGIYVDVTFGGGGHSRAILEKLTTGKLYAFDQDEDAVQNAESIDHPGFTLIQGNFGFIQKFLRLYKVTQVDGILADLGVSSHQLDERARGFSFMEDEVPLDMRMNQSASKTAQVVINTYPEEELHKIFGMYGEVKNAKSLAKEICAARSNEEIKTVGQFKNVVTRMAPKFREYKYYAQLFQAIRIEVNDEMKVLEQMIQEGSDLLKPNGRFVVMTYHSLEDRIVKSFFQKGKFKGDVEKDFYGNEIKPLRTINRKPIEATEEEVTRNVRARSAKLRVAEKI